MQDTPTNGNSPHRNGTSTIRFGMFEADLHLGEVRKSGNRIKLQDQPFKVLQVLLESPGSLVTREELQARIWPEDTYGDFDHAVNVAVGKLRTALGDSAENPSFIETIPRRGYRFIAALNHPPQHPVPPAEENSSAAPLPPETSSEPPSRSRRSIFLALAAVLAAAALLAAGIYLGRSTSSYRAPAFQQLTVGHGTVYAARFAPDGHSAVYSASWDGAPLAIFSADLDMPGTRNFGLPGTSLLAVSSSGEMAVLQNSSSRMMLTLRGTLGQLPISGGSPRQIEENIDWADWSPDGRSLAIVRDMDGRQRIEFPAGHVLYDTTGWISHMRVSPKGDRIAFLDHPIPKDDRGSVAIIDLSGNKMILSTGWESAEGLAWAPGGSEVWFSAARAGLQHRIYAVDLNGHERLAFRALGGVTLQDIAPDGRVLLTRDEQRSGIMALAPGATRERELSWLDWSLPAAISQDGKQLLFDEQGEQGGPTYTVAIRDLEGSPPVPLGEGMAGDLSPDGKWATTVVDYSQIMLLPTGPGTARRIDRGDVQQYSHMVHWMPDGKGILFSGSTAGHLARCYVQSVVSGKPRAVTPEGMNMCQVSPDGKVIAAVDPDGKSPALYPLDGSAPRPIPGLQPGEGFSWTGDPHVLYVYQWKHLPAQIFRMNIDTGQRQFFREITPDATGLCDMSHALISRDGRSYVYGYTRLLSDLYLVKGLK